MNASNGTKIQAMPLGRGNATSPYTVTERDQVIEFTEQGAVICNEGEANETTTQVLAGARYSISSGIKTITFGGTFSIG